MEYALRVQKNGIVTLLLQSLNPYSNGICSKSAIARKGNGLGLEGS